MVFQGSKKEIKYWWTITILGCIWFVGLPILYFSLGLDHSKKPFLEIILIILAILLPILMIFFLYKVIKSTFEGDYKKELIKKIKSPLEVEKEMKKNTIFVVFICCIFLFSGIIGGLGSDNTFVIISITGTILFFFLIWLWLRRLRKKEREWEEKKKK